MKPDPRIPKLLKEIKPKTSDSLCKINEKLNLGKKCEGKQLPPLEYPKEVYLFKQTFNDDTIFMYGTSHIKKAMKALGRDVDIDVLTGLERKSAKNRRKILKNLLETDKVATKFKSDIEYFSSLALNMWISEETYERLYPHVQQLNKELEAGGDKDQIIRRLVRLVIKNDDYLANWGLFPLLLNIKDDITYHSPEVEYYMRNFISIVRNTLVKRLDYDIFAPKDPTDPIMRIIPKGTLFYRGYRTYRGASDSTREFAWFAFDVFSTMSYLVPPKKEDNNSYLAETVIFTDTYRYCAGVGGVAAFKIKKDLKVLDFSKFETIRELKKILKQKNAPQNVIDAFKHGWELSKEKSTFERYSVDVLDGFVADWLCENGYNGYIAMQVPGLHDEVMICWVSENMEYVGDYDPRKDMNFDVCKKPYSNVDTKIIYW